MSESAENLPTLTLMLTRLTRLNEEFLHKHCFATGTTAAEFRVLSMLCHTDLEGPISPTTISEWIVQTSGGLSATLGRLQERGLVDRLEDPADGRSLLVQITPGGRKLHDQLFAELLGNYEPVLGAVDPDLALSVVRSLIEGFETAMSRAASGSWKVPVRGDRQPASYPTRQIQESRR